MATQSALTINLPKNGPMICCQFDVTSNNFVVCCVRNVPKQKLETFIPPIEWHNAKQMY